jgi:hypothetical protein
MKTLSALALFLALSLNASAAVLQLDSGDVVTLSPNVFTTVSCGGGGSAADCGAKTDTLSKTLIACSPAQDMNADDCVVSVWPSWKGSNPSCTSEGSLACIEYCRVWFEASWCAKSCS